MKKENSCSGNARLLPFHVIKAASEGNVEAITVVLRHYGKYIGKLSIRRLYDEYGQPHYCVDETLRRRLETRLIEKALSFQILN